MDDMIGMNVKYRRKDGTVVSGEVVASYREPHFTFENTQLAGEKVAYRLKLSKEDQERIGHPVTIGGSRLIWDEEEGNGHSTSSVLAGDDESPPHPPVRA